MQDDSEEQLGTWPTVVLTPMLQENEGKDVGGYVAFEDASIALSAMAALL